MFQVFGGEGGAQFLSEVYGCLEGEPQSRRDDVKLDLIGLG